MQVSSSPVPFSTSSSYEVPERNKTTVSLNKSVVDRPDTPEGSSKKKRIMVTVAKVMLASACIGAAVLLICHKAVEKAERARVEEAARVEGVEKIKVITMKLKNLVKSKQFMGANEKAEIALSTRGISVGACFEKDIDNYVELMVKQNLLLRAMTDLSGWVNLLQPHLLDIVKSPRTFEELATNCTDSLGIFTPEYLAKNFKLNNQDCFFLKEYFNVTCLQKAGK
jgi:hypothetical protein